MKALNGPLASMGDQVFQGPIVRIGANPGPGGFKLTGYRGLDARHCVVTCYEGGEATIAPVGGNQVRMAPHEHVNWKEIDPVSGTEYLSKGCAIHLGPVGRGATLSFTETRRLGVWQQGRVGSDAAGVSSEKVSAQVEARATVQARKPPRARRINPLTLPIGLMGCFFLLTSTVVAVVAVAIVVPMLDPEPPPLGAEFKDLDFTPEEWKDRYRGVSLDGELKMSEKALGGLEEPFRRFIMRDNKKAAAEEGVDGAERIAAPKSWDSKFFDYFVRSIEEQVQSRYLFKKLYARRGLYADTLELVREAGLPEVLAGVPMTESQYEPREQSFACAKGLWQFMPETAKRYRLRVKDCKIKKDDGSVALWEGPELNAPPARPIYRKFAEKGSGQKIGSCRIPKEDGCKIDDRSNPSKATPAALQSFSEPWEDADFRKSGSLVQMTIMTHNAGYDDERFGVVNRYNIRRVYKKWRKKNSADVRHEFYGKNIRSYDCLEERKTSGKCKSPLNNEAQHYVYTTLARHTLAACFYGKNYSSTTVFSSWDRLLTDTCSQFKIPSKSEVKGW